MTEIKKLTQYKIIWKQARAGYETEKLNYVCIGTEGIDQSAKRDYALKKDENDQITIDESKCSRCLMCSLVSKNIIIDDNYLPFHSDNPEQNNLSMKAKMQLNTIFHTKLSAYQERQGISKWLYILFKEFGFSTVYAERSIDKSLMEDKTIFEIFPKLTRRSERLGGQARSQEKSVRADLEIQDGENLIVFENKKDESLNFEEPLGQIVSYKVSKPYVESSKKNKYFILCYNGGTNFSWDTIKKRISSKQSQKIEELFSDSSHHLSVVPSIYFYSEVLHSVSTDTKDKNRIMQVIKENIIL